MSLDGEGLSAPLFPATLDGDHAISIRLRADDKTPGRGSRFETHRDDQNRASQGDLAS
jgi:hypothetical protein